MVMGNFDSSAAANVMVVLERCENKTSPITCKSDAEIEAFLDFKYILLLHNERKFIQYRFGQGSINTMASLKWYGVNKKNRADFVLKFQRTSIGLADSLFSIAGLGSVMENGFYSTDGATRELIYKNNYHNSITLEMSFTHIEYLRKVYSTLDLFAELGGLFSSI